MIGFADLITFHCILTNTANFLKRFVTLSNLLTHTRTMESNLTLLLIMLTAHCLLVWLEHRDVGVVAAGDVLVLTLQHWLSAKGGGGGGGGDATATIIFRSTTTGIRKLSTDKKW